MKPNEMILSFFSRQSRVGRRALGLGLCAVGALGALGCKSRDSIWDTRVGDAETVGLEGSVALMDRSLDRVLFLTSPGPQKLKSTALPVGLDVLSVEASRDGDRLFVLSAGVQPRVNSGDEWPQLIVFSGGTEPKEEKRFRLDDPMQKLAIDPEGEWVIAYQGDAEVTNANELVFLPLPGESTEPISKTIRSFGGAPVEISFTSELTVPKGPPRRFVVVRTDRDIALIDLSDLSAEEVTIPMPDDEDDEAIAPLQVVFDDGEADVDDDARLAVRLENSSDVVLLELGSSLDSRDDFAVVPNIVDVGGVPSTIDFVRTDGGLRLAALVPGAERATLVDPESTAGETVDLGHTFDRMTRITSLVDGTPDGGDVALLWGRSTQIAFWSLGSTSSTPYRSVDSTELGVTISEVLDVPAPNQHLKVLLSQTGGGFFVLDLQNRESFPLTTKGSGYSVEVSRDGQRLWVTRPGGEDFSMVDLSNLHPDALHVEPGINGLFDIARGDDGRSAIAFHELEGWSATVLDAQAPDPVKTAYYPALELGGLF
jgi:hypothetical protein